MMKILPPTKQEEMSAATPTSTTSRPCHPCILACGYKSIYIPKSGLEFPAWLVCFDDIETDNEQPAQGDVTSACTATTPCSTSHEAAVTSDGSIESCRTPCETPQKNGQSYFWRSKRDFWRLARATAAAATASEELPSSSKIVFPKAAWKKLSNEAPWKRPDYNDYNATDDVIQTQDKNGWKRHMCKSLRQVDQYLEQVALSICDSHDSNNKDDVDMKSSDQQQVREAWKEFCRPCHTENLKDTTTADSSIQAARTGAPSIQSLSSTVSDAATCAAAAAAATAKSTAMTGNALGQYFCHPANARQLVHVCLEKIQQQVCENNHHGENETNHFLFVEPSCGHGQVLEALLDELGRRQEDHQQPLPTPTGTGPTVPSQSSATASTRLFQLDWKQCSFVGMDIDPNAIAHCREFFSKRCSDSNDTQPDITWMTLDFLQSQRSRVMKNRRQVDIDSGTTEKKKKTMVVVLGGPPYSAGAGHGSGQRSSSNSNDAVNGSDFMQRDLPMRFVQHAVQELGASIVTLLMPERCGKHDANCRENESYALANIALEAPSVFYFQGLASVPVKQPSIIQCFWKA